MTDLTGPVSDLNAQSKRLGAGAPEFLPTAFRRAQTSEPPKPAPELTALFEGGAELMQGQTVTAYLQAFCSPTQPMSGLLRDLKEIWDSEGALPVDDLTLQLLKKRNKDLPPAAIDLLHDQIKAHYRDPEPLTGYDRKEHAPLTIGLGHLYGVVTGRPVATILADDSNLGGLIEHIDKVMAARDGRAPGQTEEGSPAYKLADRVLRTIAGVSRDALQNGINDTRRMASQSAYRNGGDEKLYVVTGLTAHALQTIIDTRMTPANEELMAKMGLSKHEATKARDDRTLAGSSTAFTIVMLDQYNVPGIDQVEAEIDLSARKQNNGAYRRGRLPASMFNEMSLPILTPRLRDDLQTEFAQPLSDNDFSNLLQLETANKRARSIASSRKHFDALAKNNANDYSREAQRLDYDLATYDEATGQYGSTSKRNIAPYNMDPTTADRLLEGIEAVLRSSDYIKYQQHAGPKRHIERSSKRPNLLFASPIELDALRFDYNVQKNGIKLTPEQTAQCHTLLGSFSPKDPSTGALMKDVMPGLFGQFAHDADALYDHVKAAPKLAARLHVKPDAVQAMAVSASLGTLAGINKLLGSQNADIILRHFKEEIVEGSFKSKGIGPHNLEIGHEGGGHLMILMRPIVETPSGLRAVNGRLTKDVTNNMEKRMEKWRKMNIAEWLIDHGGTVPPELDLSMTFADIKDPKRSMQGINIVTSMLALATVDDKGNAVSGGKLRSVLAAQRDAKIDASRNGSITNRRASVNLPS